MEKMENMKLMTKAGVVSIVIREKEGKEVKELRDKRRR